MKEWSESILGRLGKVVGARVIGGMPLEAMVGG